MKIDTIYNIGDKVSFISQKGFEIHGEIQAIQIRIDEWYKTRHEFEIINKYGKYYKHKNDITTTPKNKYNIITKYDIRDKLYFLHNQYLEKGSVVDICINISKNNYKCLYLMYTPKTFKKDIEIWLDEKLLDKNNNK